MCAHFFMNIPDEQICINEQSGHQLEPKQWCYVWPTCNTDLTRGGAKYKLCGEDDEKLGDLSPVQLKRWSERNNIDVGVAVHWAYPSLSQQNIALSQSVLDIFGAEAPPSAPEWAFSPDSLSADQNKILGEQVLKGKTTVVTSRTGAPPFALFQGSQFYWLNFSDEQAELVRGGGDFYATRGMLNDVKCVAGCDGADMAEPWWSEVNDMIPNQWNPNPARGPWANGAAKRRGLGPAPWIGGANPSYP